MAVTGAFVNESFKSMGRDLRLSLSDNSFSLASLVLGDGGTVSNTAGDDPPFLLRTGGGPSDDDSERRRGKGRVVLRSDENLAVEADGRGESPWEPDEGIEASLVRLDDAGEAEEETAVHEVAIVDAATVLDARLSVSNEGRCFAKLVRPPPAEPSEVALFLFPGTTGCKMNVSRGVTLPDGKVNTVPPGSSLSISSLAWCESETEASRSCIMTTLSSSISTIESALMRLLRLLATLSARLLVVLAPDALLRAGHPPTSDDIAVVVSDVRD